MVISFWYVLVFIDQMLKGKDREMRLPLDKGLKSFDFSGLHAECLTDTWIGNDR